MEAHTTPKTATESRFDERFWPKVRVLQWIRFRDKARLGDDWLSIKWQTAVRDQHPQPTLMRALRDGDIKALTEDGKELPPETWASTSRPSQNWSSKILSLFQSAYFRRADVLRLWPGAMAEAAVERRGDNAVTELRLRPAPALTIHEAIAAVYDEAEREQAKPPNIRELAKPVQRLLSQQGRQASGIQIQKLAAEPQHDGRRRTPGKTVTSERSRRGT